MIKAFKTFIEKLHYYPEYFQTHQLQEFLNDEEIQLLKNKEILKRGCDLMEISCLSCDDGHFLEVKVHDGKLYSFCPISDIQRNYINESKVMTWVFDAEKFLQLMALNLGINTNIESTVIPNLWQVGNYSKDDTAHICYFYKGKHFEEVLKYIKTKPPQLRRYIIFTNKEEIAEKLEGYELLMIEINNIVSMEKNKLNMSKKAFDEQLTHGFRNVIFNPKNGDLFVDGKNIAMITPSSPEYYFVDILWRNFNEPISHKKIETYVYEKTNKPYDPKLCTKLKNKIKNLSNNPKSINHIFIATTDSDDNHAYIMKII